MAAIMQGTTPTIKIAIDPNDFLVTDIVDIDYRIRNDGQISQFTIDDVIVNPEDNTISKRFDATETGNMNYKKPLEIQFRCFMKDGSVIGINKLTFNIKDFMGIGND